MSGIASLQDLRKIQQDIEKEYSKPRVRVMLCGGTGCRASGSLEVLAALREGCAKVGLKSEVQIVETGCNGFCAMGPVMTLLPEGLFYQKLTPEDAPEIIERQFIRGERIKRLMYADASTGEVIPELKKIPFFALQKLWALQNKGLIDPERIEDYIWRSGYQGMLKALTEMEPQEIIEQIKISGLRGRGGGGFPTGLKWQFCAAAKGDVKYVLCNADEGDPGAFMDRSIMEADPHAVIEGMVIAAKAIGAHQGYIYCRAEYPLAVSRMKIAIAQARSMGLLGRNILKSGFDFDLEIYRGAGAFVCGEETALMTSIEGKRGMPRPRPPFPAVSGLWEKPTVLNNVETLANVAQIVMKGGAEYASMGTDSSKGTKVFALTGKVNNIGLVEVPMGTTIGEIVFDIGGGIPGGKKFKAVQLGGPSGGCLPAEHLNLPTDYEAITMAGAIMGSGGMIVMDEDTCMVDMARYFMDFCQDESCGKCTACRIGTQRMLEILQRICRGEGKVSDIGLLEEFATSIKDSALCGLGQTAPNPVLSTIRYFKDEYLDHIERQHCPAVVCSSLFKSPCQHACPLGMDIPAYVALVRADRINDAYKILKRTNPFPSVCGRVCGHLCQLKCRRSQLDAPLAVMHLKRFITDNAHRPSPVVYPVTRPEKIAVVGAGPSGLTAALEMKKRGYAVTVFEEMPEPGGMLRYGIPAYRLPREILKQEIEDILDAGVELKTGVRIGRDISLDEIKNTHRAVYLALGAHRSIPLGILGEDAEGVIGAVEMLRRHNLGESMDLGKKVAVIGGGNSAVDAARTALRLGAKTVTIFYRRERGDMPAQACEIEAAEKEGVRIQFLTAPVRVITEKGRVKSLELSRMRLGIFDRSGRKQPAPITDSEFIEQVDTVISAISQEADCDLLTTCEGVEHRRNRITVDSAMATTDPRIWAGGDAVAGPAMVVDAIAAGKAAAASMDEAIRKINGEKPWTAPPEEKIDIPYEIDEDPQEQPQAAMSEEQPDVRRGDFREVEKGYDIHTAQSEARRCMRCDAAR